MDCAYCATPLEAGSAFCHACGKPISNGAARSRKLCRHPADGRIAGVCAGIAHYLDADVALVRLVWVILSIVPGAFFGGVLGYLAAMIVMPVASAPPVDHQRPVRRLTRSISDRKLGGVCGGLGEYLSADPTAVRLVWIVLTIVPGAIVLGLVAYLIAWFSIPEGRTEVLTAAPSAA